MALVSFTQVAPPSPGAVAYALSRLGLRVFPLRRDTGTPSFARWTTLATTDEARIQQWWTGDYALCGVGVATGPESGIWVLDIDVKDANGYDTLRSLCERNGADVAAFTDTLCVRTPSGGAHVYFRWNDEAGSDGGVRNSTKTLGAGLDVRGIGGYVRAAEVGAYRIVERDGRKHVRITAAPSWLTPLCKQRRASAYDPVTNADVRARMLDGGAQWARFETAEAVRKLRVCAEGTRNDMLNRTAFKLGKLFATCGVPSEDVAREQCFAALAEAGARDNLDQQARTFASGWSSGIASVAEQRSDTEKPPVNAGNTKEKEAR